MQMWHTNHWLWFISWVRMPSFQPMTSWSFLVCVKAYGAFLAILLVRYMIMQFSCREGDLFLVWVPTDCTASPWLLHLVTFEVVSLTMRGRLIPHQVPQVFFCFHWNRKYPGFCQWSMYCLHVVLCRWSATCPANNSVRSIASMFVSSLIVF